MVDAFPIAFLFFAGALLLLALPKGALRASLLLVIPVLSGITVWNLPEGSIWTASLMGLDLELMRVDKLSRIFALIFSVAAFLGNLYA